MSWVPLRWFVRNLGTLLLAFLLAFAVWISAVVTADPNEQYTFRPVAIEQIGLSPDLLLGNEIPAQVRVTLKAPRSIWTKLNDNPDLVRAWIDLSGLVSGEHTLTVKIHVDASPVHFVSIEPAEIQVNLENLVQHEYTIQVIEKGQLPLGYKKGSAQVEPGKVLVSGSESQMSRVAEARVIQDISGATETISRELPIVILDKDGEVLTDLKVMPKEVIISQQISLLGGFKNVVVKVVTTGQVAEGYRLTNISVSPPNVTLFSDNPQLINGVPGFVETLPVDLTGLNDDIELSVDLNLPEGIVLIREPDVLVQVSVAAIESSLTLSVPVEIIGLTPEYIATISPETVDVIVAGPLNILEGLTLLNFRVVLDLTGLPPGIYQRPPVVDLTPDRVRVQTTLPETVEVVIELVPTPSPAKLKSSTPSPTPTPTSNLIIAATGTPRP
jgi:YbbR domain-containing protein